MAWGCYGRHSLQFFVDESVKMEKKATIITMDEGAITVTMKELIDRGFEIIAQYNIEEVEIKIFRLLHCNPKQKNVMYKVRLINVQDIEGEVFVWKKREIKCH